jgi:hypothetical protein
MRGEPRGCIEAIPFGENSSRSAGPALGRGWPRLELDHQTTLAFQPPLRNSHALTTAIVENAIGIDRNTPFGPTLARCERNQASGSSHNQAEQIQDRRRPHGAGTVERVRQHHAERVEE